MNFTSLSVAPHPSDPWLAMLEGPHGAIPLSMLAGIHSPGDCDGWSAPNWRRLPNEAGWDIAVNSTRWESASLDLRTSGKALELGLRVRGKGKIETISYLEGALAERIPHRLATSRLVRRNPLRPRHYGSATPAHHQRIFNPQPEARTGPWYDAAESVPITVATTFGPDRFDTFFSPGIWCYVLDLGPGKGFLSCGLLAEMGTQHFHTFEYRGGTQFGFALHYDGMTQVDGEFMAPRLRLAHAESADAALEEYVGHLRATGLVPSPTHEIPAWWHRPVFCGWGSQVAWGRLAENKKLSLFDQGAIDTSAGSFASQKAYEKMVELLEKHRLPYGTLIIDMGWSTSISLPEIDHAKWPDLPGFIRREHEKGKKVLLWLGCWSPKDMPEDCVMDADSGLKRVIDPTKTAFRERLQAAITRVIGPEIDADGFKIDFTGDTPRGAGYRPSRPLWGMELLHDYIRLIHDAMKAAKPDALLETHCANPSFGAITGVLRLNDLFFDQLDVTGPMAFRARMARMACPEWLIDTDGDPFSSADSWRQYQLFQPQIGIPSLYDLTHTSGATEPIPEEWLAEVAASWNAYLDVLATKDSRKGEPKRVE
jgi:hypothetical protein